MEMVRWPIDPTLEAELARHYRTEFARALAGKDPLTIAQAVTFDGDAPEVTIAGMRALLQRIQRESGRPFRGVVLEAGAGCGFFSTLLSGIPGVAEVYAMDACANQVELLMSRVVEALRRPSDAPVTGCVGEFARIGLPDESVDAIFDFYSLHHAPDLGAVFQEFRRVLRPDGVIVCLDKARANRLDDAALDALLDVEYTEEAKKKMGVDPAVRLTRRMNGEREFRLKDWQRLAEGAGLAVTHLHVAKTVSRHAPVRWMKWAFSRLPFGVQRRLLGTRRLQEVNHLECAPYVYAAEVNALPKEPSLLLIRPTKNPRS